MHNHSVSEPEQGLDMDVINELNGDALPLTPGASSITPSPPVLMKRAPMKKAPMKKAPMEKAPMEKARMVTGDFISDFIRLPRSSSPAGSVSLDVACDRHGGRLMRLWMSREARGSTLFGGDGRNEVWDTDTQGRGAVIVKCTWPGCHRSARLTNDWLEARLLHVRADYEAGQGLPIAQIPLSQVGVF
jgi:hypothetical protein